MKIIWINEISFKKEVKRLLLLMKITLIILFICIFQLQAVTSYGQTAVLSVETKEVALEEVFKEIEEQSEFLFNYRDSDINHIKARVNIKNGTIKEILTQALRNTDLSFSINDRHVTIYKASKEVKEAKKVITGNVKDNRGELLLGVSIVIKGTSTGTVTDIDGNYSIEVPDEHAVLVFNYLGYKTKELSIAGKMTLDVIIMEDTRTLEEVVVVGYGTQKKTSLSGSISTVKGEETVKSPAMNILNTLTGRLPGVIINSRSDEPGRESIDMFIRGRSTLGNNSPLYIIDGVERNTLGQLNPQDIESFTVLKDASAAIYGARSANGVVLVTTKRGIEGKPRIDLSFNQGYTQPTRKPQMGDSYTFAKIWNETLEYDGMDPQFSQTELDAYRNGTDPNYPNTNWYDVMIKKLTPQRRTNLSLSGGNERVKYYVSLAEAMQKGHFNYGNTNTQQFSVRSNIDVKVNDWLSIGLDLTGRQHDKKYPHFATFEIYSHIFLNFPTYQPFWPGTNYLSPGRDSDNLINLVGNAEGYDKQKIQNFESTLSAVIKVPWIKGLSLNLKGSFDTDNNYTKRFQQPTYVYQKNVDTGELEKVRAGRGVNKPVLSDRIDRATMTYLNAQVNYERTLDVHKFGALVGYEQKQRSGNFVQAGRSDYISTMLPEVILGSPDPMKWTTNGNSSREASQSIFSRLNYEYDNKYILQATFRVDGSANFPKGNRFGFFPSVSGAWRISQEEFMSDISFIDDLKIRGSFGSMGNDKVNAWQYLTMYDTGDSNGNLYNYVIGGVDVNGIMPSSVANPNITWEVAKTWNLGIDARFLNGLLNVEFDYFHTKRDNILAQRNAVIPDYTGLRLPSENIGKMQNQGMELILSHFNQVQDFTYSVTGNVSFARNKILFKDEAPAAEPYQLETGRPLGSGLYYKYLGVFQNQEQLDNYPNMAGYGIGDAKYEDVNKDGVIDSKDRIRLDHGSTPEIVFGLNATASYKGFDFSVLFQGQANAARNLSGFNVELNYTWGNFYQEVARDRWSLDNPTGTKPRANSILFRNQEANTLWYVNAAFLRLKNLELGYTLPHSVTGRIGLEAVRFSISGNNLCLLFDSLKDWGLDPEESSPWGGGYSLQRTYNFGVNVTF